MQVLKNICFRESCVKENLTLSCMFCIEHRCAVSVILLKPGEEASSGYTESGSTRSITTTITAEPGSAPIVPATIGGSSGLLSTAIF